jgi:hypothetical protein
VKGAVELQLEVELGRTLDSTLKPAIGVDFGGDIHHKACPERSRGDTKTLLVEGRGEEGAEDYHQACPERAASHAVPSRGDTKTLLDGKAAKSGTEPARDMTVSGDMTETPPGISDRVPLPETDRVPSGGSCGKAAISRGGHGVRAA